MASVPTLAPTSEHNTPDLIEQYEMLRTYTMKHRNAASRHGLVVLLREGVASWMEICGMVPKK